MKYPCTKSSTLAVLLVCTLGMGCNRSSAPPTPLSAAEFPAAFEKAFSRAKPEVKDLATQLVAALQSLDYSKAHAELQTLAGLPELTKEQITITSRGFLTVNTLLQEAQAKGDAKAAETIKIYRETK